TTTPSILPVAMGKPDIGLKSNLSALFILLPITVVLIVALGLVGAGLSWVAYNAWLYVYLVPRVTRECLHTPTLAWFAHLAKAFAASGLISGLAWLAIVVPTGYSLLGCVAASILATVASVAAALSLLGPDLKSPLP